MAGSLCGVWVDEAGRVHTTIETENGGRQERLATLRPYESQFLLQQRERLYREMTFGQLRRCQLDIEVAAPDGGFPDATRPDDRILAIGFRCNGKNRLLLLETMTDEA